ncbi:MAG TPA: gamma-glutamyl-gamma-aminobutyrate hydrolase family protein [Actinomycetota bacterium]|nr:gamma-glutamyl-gamma-aminobutyrate hydrolase family protein [Actinomycetota bacterium]
MTSLDTTTRGSRSDRPWIAVIGQWRRGYLRVPIPYTHAVELAGGDPRVLSTFELPPREEAPEDLEIRTGLDPHDPSPLGDACGLVIPGGGDIDPALYGARRHPRTHAVSQRRDRFELTLLGEALERDMPVLAICHGMQLLNVAEGGTLNQHLLDDASKLDHYRDRPMAEPAHGVSLKEGSRLAEIMGSVSVAVNTHHHQGLDDVASSLEPIGWSEDGVLEAVVDRGHTWVLGVQWHPEAMAPVDENELAIFRAFVEATNAYRERVSRVTARSA